MVMEVEGDVEMENKGARLIKERKVLGYGEVVM